MPALFRPAAIAVSVFAPPARIWAIVGARSAALSAARMRLAAAPCFWASRLMVIRRPSLFLIRVPPSLVPRALAALRAAFVRAEIIPASNSATATICCSRKRPVAPSICGRSANLTSTFASRRRLRNAPSTGLLISKSAADGVYVPRTVALKCTEPWLTQPSGGFFVGQGAAFGPAPARLARWLSPSKTFFGQQAEQPVGNQFLAVRRPMSAEAHRIDFSSV